MAVFYDMFADYNKMETDNVLVSFKGIITKDLLNAFCEVIDKKLDVLNEEPKIRKKVYNILVETLQNVYHHVADLTDDVSDENEFMHDAMFVILRDDNGGYAINTGNFIMNDKIQKFEARLNHVNSLTPEELRSHYVDSLNNSEFSDKGGAGLGIIDIARKSGNKLSFKFNKVNNAYSFFSLIIHIGKNDISN